MNRKRNAVLVAIAALAVVTLIVFAGATKSGERSWVLKAQNALVIGGYGDNFNYTGENVRPLIGTAVVNVDSASNAGSVIAVFSTTPESGSIHIAKDECLDGEVKIVMSVFQGEVPFMDGGIAEFLWIHGDTSQGPPVMPRQFSFLAGWGLLDIYVNGELLYEKLDGHFMYTEQARRSTDEGYRVMRDDGTIYNPMLADKTRFTDPANGELHIVAHSTVADPDNFPPQSHWIHLNFADVFVEETPVSLSLAISP
ncbi:hypothetical protein KAW44_04120 [Candidatus Bipolaricaulota bacterium]|nr:hypothetical protein [Candidatus Bipolaricaulota bacterium]